MNLACFISFFLVFCSSIEAHWTERLRSCSGKGSNHSFPEIDFIYLINLNERPKKLELCLSQLNPYGIFPYRFEAINGWAMDPFLLKGLGTPDLFPNTPPGKIACLLSQLSVLVDAYQSNYKTIWMMEDDIEIVEDPTQLSSLIRALDSIIPDWDILYTDPETKDFYGNQVSCLSICPRPNIQLHPLSFYLRRIPINSDFLEIGMRYGCYSMIIRRSGIEKILSYFTKCGLYLPLDMELFFVPELKQIALTRDIVSTRPGTKSDTTFSLEENDRKTPWEF